jgi:tetratricopeptide (TPR) repeat protein
VVVGKDGRVLWTGHPGMPQMKQLVVDLLEGKFDSDGAIKQASLDQQLEKLNNDLFMAMQQGKAEEALAATDRMLELDPANFDAMQYRVAIYVEELQSTERLREWAESFIAARAGNAEALAKIAHLMLAIPDIRNRQPDLAVKAAKAAYSADDKRPEIAQAVAMVYYQIGDLPAALRYQQHALEIAKEGPAADEAKVVLKFFETCKSLHEASAQPAGG